MAHGVYHLLSMIPGSMEDDWYQPFHTQGHQVQSGHRPVQPGTCRPFKFPGSRCRCPPAFSLLVLSTPHALRRFRSPGLEGVMHEGQRDDRGYPTHHHDRPGGGYSVKLIWVSAHTSTPAISTAQASPSRLQYPPDHNHSKTPKKWSSSCCMESRCLLRCHISRRRAETTSDRRLRPP
jgi:hypothetical protein